ncbi:MAG: hypothetical protein HZA59_00590 [Hydrogenophilales bacterium]|nr:hypothetical protein [Hydrogenophilales bacterium]
MSKQNEKTSISEALGNAGGQYVWDEETKRYRYSDKVRLDEIVTSENRQQALPILVACIDDESPTQTRLNGRPVMLGILCYQALTQIAYYEPTEPGGDISKSWPGHISPIATVNELRAAKKAWQQVLENKLFIFL